MLASLLSALVGCASDVEEPRVHIAFGRDFEGYRDWLVFDRGEDPVPPSHQGRSVIYVDALPEPGARRFDVGTRIVRVERVGDDPRGWEVHAM
ncbi:MAG TPA: hypothetical protein RMH99_06930, partial [Sandaracinaceae bacterium LLY-WYZ-13_1]|nr:hypothetical protein [Sandaracinaceae bacterium LLY-WYZ-13_1]